jgi:WD40 repeat protein
MAGTLSLGSGDKAVRVWDAQTGQSAIDPLKGHNDWVTSVAFSPDGKHIVSGSYDQTVRVWDAQTGHSVKDPLNGDGDWVNSLAFSSDGRHIASISRDKTVRVLGPERSQTIMNPFTVSHLSTPSISNIPVLPILSIHSQDGNNISMSGSHKTSFCDCYDISLLKFCHLDGNWIMLPDDTYLLWMPDPNKSGLFWPRTTTVIGCTPTLLEFKNFVHGKNWSQCFASLLDAI